MMRMKCCGLRHGWLEMASSRLGVRPLGMASGNGLSIESRRRAPVFHRRKFSATVFVSMGLRKSIHGSYAPLGLTQTSGNSASAFLGRSPPRKL